MDYGVQVRTTALTGGWRVGPMPGRGEQANKAHLSETVGSQVDAARTGTNLLDVAQRSLSKMRESYKVCEALQSLSAICVHSGKTKKKKKKKRKSKGKKK